MKSPHALTAQEIAAVLRRVRLPLHDEKATQARIAEQLTHAQLAFEREVHLSDADIVDFMIDGIAIEVKLKGQRRAIVRQLERYAQHAGVAAVMLVTSRCIQLPAELNGRRVHVVSLSEAWL